MSASSPALDLPLQPRARARADVPWRPGATTRAVLLEALRSRSTQVGLLLLVVIGLAALFAPVVAAHDPMELEPARRLLPPSPTHWLGTDDLGRDVFARLVHGARMSLTVGAVVSAASIVLGTLVGLLSTAHRGADAVLMRAVDGLMAFPAVLLGIAVVVRLGPTLPGVLLALTLVYTPIVARLVRTTTLVGRAQPHVEAARAIGAGPFRILTRHVLPTTISPLLAQWSFIAGLAVLTEASLSFLGASVGADAVTWGGVLRDGQRLLAIAWWVAVPAGAVLTTTVVACTLVGDGIRDALDPRQRHLARPRREAGRERFTPGR